MNDVSPRKPQPSPADETPSSVGASVLGRVAMVAALLVGVVILVIVGIRLA
jgi:hypothetical protein